MNSKISSIIAIGMHFMNEMETRSENWKDRIRAEWENSKNYPRKKKKRVRKELVVEWSIACWSPFDDLKF
jgi:hypothetical protein